MRHFCDFFQTLHFRLVNQFMMFFQCAAFTSLGVICISTFCFILSTLPELQEEEDFEDEEVKIMSNKNEEWKCNPFFVLFKKVVPIMLTDGNVSTTPAAVIDLAALFEGPFIDYEVVKSVLKMMDLVTVVYFCAEYVVRFVCSPDKKKFFFTVSLTRRLQQMSKVINQENLFK